MTTDQYKSDVQTLEMILEGDREFLQAHYIRDLNHFHDAVTTLWGLDERYHSTVFISFMHYLTDNNAAVLKRLKLQTLCEREQRTPVCRERIYGRPGYDTNLKLK